MVEIVTLLLNAGANPRIENELGSTPLDRASSDEGAETIRRSLRITDEKRNPVS